MEWDSSFYNRIQSWHFACPSAAVPRGGVVTRTFLGTQVVLFRTSGGSLHALSARCSHMGAHLGQGRVVGDRLQCPLHHWEYDGQGVCRRIPVTHAIPEKACQFSYPVEERYGAVFLFNGPEPLFAPPRFSDEPEARYRTALGRPVRLGCSPVMVVANAFDMQHLQTVHERALREPPILEQVSPYHLRLRYVSRVIGESAADRTMRGLSRDRIQVTINCWGGTLLTVESDLGRVRSALLLGLASVGEGAEVTLIFCVRQSAFPLWDAVRVGMAGWLFGGFLGRDVAILDGMRLRPHPLLPDDEILQRSLEFLAQLPQVEGASERPRARNASLPL